MNQRLPHTSVLPPAFRCHPRQKCGLRNPTTATMTVERGGGAEQVSAQAVQMVDRGAPVLADGDGIEIPAISVHLVLLGAPHSNSFGGPIACLPAPGSICTVSLDKSTERAHGSGN